MRTPVVLIALAAACAPHRQDTSLSVPAPLVSALIDARVVSSGSTPQISVGTLPAGYPAALVPTGRVHVVGGMRSGDEIVAVFADSTRRLAPVPEDAFRQAGYTNPKASPGSGFSPGSGPFTFFCSDSGTVSAEQLTGPNRDLARVTYRRQRMGRGCAVYSPSPADTAYLKLPPLTGPPGVRVAGSGGGSNSDGVNSRAELTGTDLVPSVILAHYAAQLVAAGWKASPPAVSDHVAAQYFEATSTSGAPWEGVLMASGGGTRLNMSLNMHARGKR